MSAIYRLTSCFQAIGYLPRALVVGLFAPFPDFWVEKLSLPRVIGALETLMFYLFFGVFFRSGAGADYLLVTYSCFGIMGPALFNFATGIASDRGHGWLIIPADGWCWFA